MSSKLLCMLYSCLCSHVFFYVYRDHRYLPGLTHSFPTRRSSDLQRPDAHCGGAFLAKPRRSVRDDLVARSILVPPGIASHDRLLYGRSEEHTSALQSLMRISYAVFCLKKKKRSHT